MEFVANLRSETIDAFSGQPVQPHAYLLTTHRASPGMLRHAHAIRDAGIPLFADNGTKKLIDEVIDKYKAPAALAVAELRQVRRRLGRTPRGSSVPADLRQRASELARTVVRECTERSKQIDWRGLLDQQLAMRPTHLIAQEDFSVGCLIALGLEREITNWPVEYFDRQNDRSLRLFQRVASDPRCRNVKVYAVLSAMDYNTARAAGLRAARSGIARAAIGLAGMMGDRTAVDFFVIGGVSRTLDRPAPRRYVRIAQVARGLADGYRAVGAALKAFHGLGLGAPTAFPVLAGPFDPVTKLTVDSTSPIHDAVSDHVLYRPDRNGDRVSLLDIVDDIVRGVDWPCTCPFCQGFRRAHGYSAEAAQQWWNTHDRPPLRSVNLRPGEPIAQAIPLFSWPMGPEGRATSRSHIAHNHVVLSQLAERIPDDARRRQWAMKTIDECLTYESLVTSRGLRAAREVLADCATPPSAARGASGRAGARAR